MTATKYSYTVSADFPSGAANISNLFDEIDASSIVTAVDKQKTILIGDILDLWFKDALSAQDKTLLDGDVSAPCGGLIAAHDSETKTPAVTVRINSDQSDDTGRIKTSSEIGVGQGFRMISHNFCNPRTWWQKSTRHQQQPTTTLLGLEYDITGHDNLIDVRHAHLTFENDIGPATIAPDGTQMDDIIPTVYLNGSPLDQALEDAASGTDRYTIDYVQGKVSFAVARLGVTVTVSFRKAGSSEYRFVPPPGKRMVMSDAEIDFTDDVDMLAPFQTEVWGSHSTLTGGAVVPIGKNVYKNFRDFHSVARRFNGELPGGIGGAGGVAQKKWTFEWRYSKSDIFYASAVWLDQHGKPNDVTWNHVNLSIQGDQPYGGSDGAYMTVSYYGYTEDEPQAV